MAGPVDRQQAHLVAFAACFDNLERASCAVWLVGGLGPAVSGGLAVRS